MPRTIMIDGVPSSRLPEYEVWTSMNQRCRNPNSPVWARYGGRVFKESTEDNVLAFCNSADPTWDLDGPRDLVDGFVDSFVNLGVSDLNADIVDWDVGHEEVSREMINYYPPQ